MFVVVASASPGRAVEQEDACALASTLWEVDDQGIAGKSLQEIESRASRRFGSDVGDAVKRLRGALVGSTDRDTLIFMPESRQPIVLHGALGPIPTTVEMRFTNAACLEVEFDPPTWDSGSLRVQAKGQATVTATLGTSSRHWTIPFQRVELTWGTKEDGVFSANVSLHAPPRADGAILDVDKLLDLPLRVTEKSDVYRPLSELLASPDLEAHRLPGITSFVLAAIATPATPTRQANALVDVLAELGPLRLSGETWGRLSALAASGRLSARHMRRLGLSTANAAAEPSRGAVTFVSAEGQRPPDLFVEGKRFDGWSKQADGTYQLSVDGVGLKPVHVEENGKGVAFWAAFGAPAKVKVWVHNGPLLTAVEPGPRCVLVSSRARPGCTAVKGQELRPGEVADIGRCTAGFVWTGSLAMVGAYVLATRPGLYTLGDMNDLHFDPTFANAKRQPTSCSDVRPGTP